MLLDVILGDGSYSEVDNGDSYGKDENDNDDDEDDNRTRTMLSVILVDMVKGDCGNDD